MGDLSTSPSDRANAIVVSFTDDRRITDWNIEAERTFGWTRAEAIGRRLEDVVRGDGGGPIENAIARLLEGAPVWACETRRQARDGSDRIIWSIVTRISPEGSTPVEFTVVAHDITSRAQAEERLRAFHDELQQQKTMVEAANLRLARSKRRYRELVENLNDVVFALDNEQRISYVSPAVRKYGYEPRDLVGKPFWSIVHPDDVQPLGEALQRPDRDPNRPYEFRAVDAHGGVHHVRSSSRDVFEDSRLVGVTGVLIDLTEQRRAEEQLRASQRLEAVGRLAGGVAHDFNNLLVAIIGYAEFAMDSLREGDPVRKDVEEILHAGQRAAALTHQLLAFSRRQVLQPEIINLNDVVSGMEGMLRRLIGEDIDLQTTLNDGLAPVLADPGQIEQVIMNLVVNARDAMPTGGRLRIETAESDVPLEAAEPGRDSPRGWIVLSVADTGTGMDADTRARVFEPFFTTKPSGEGTGLGLATVYGIVRQSGGAVTVESEPGRGTTFRVALPREVGQVTPRAPRAKTPAAHRGTETVLIAEDEESVRELARRFLAAAGYHVLTAANGGEALLVCERYEGRIHLLLTDVVMPQMSGRELADRLARVKPDMRVLFMSGYTGTVIEQHHRDLDQGLRLIEKPFSGAELVRRVRAVLDETREAVKPGQG